MIKPGDLVVLNHAAQKLRLRQHPHYDLLSRGEVREIHAQHVLLFVVSVLTVEFDEGGMIWKYIMGPGYAGWNGFSDKYFDIVIDHA
jgi:hypothetical protein